MQGVGLQIAEMLLPIFMALLSWGAVALANFIRAKVKNEYLAGALVRLNDAVLSAVKEVQQTIVDGLREARTDGVITEEEKDQIKARAVAAVRAYLGVRGLLELGKILGLDDSSLGAMIAGKIEAAVHDLRASKSDPPKP